MAESIDVLIRANAEEFRREIKKAGANLDSFSKDARGAGKIIGGLFAVDVLKDAAVGIFNIRSEFEKYEAILRNARGVEQSVTDLRLLEKEAKRLPFSLGELTGAFIKLSNQNLTPTRDEIRKLADVAAFTGKGLDQLAEATIDAITGENERLKEFGIQAKSVGDQVTFSFRGQSTVVQKTSKDIQAYLVSLGDIAEVSGSAAALSNTASGALNNLGDAAEQFVNQVAKLGDGAIKGFFKDLTEGLEDTSLQLRKAKVSFDTFYKSIRGERVDININTQNVATAQARLEELEFQLKQINAEPFFYSDKTIRDVNQLVAAQKAIVSSLQLQEGRAAAFNDETVETVRNIQAIKAEIKGLQAEQETAEFSVAIKLQADIEGLEAELKRFTDLPEPRELPIKLRLDTESVLDASLGLEEAVNLIPKRDPAAFSEFARTSVEEINEEINKFKGLQFDLFGGVQFDAKNAELLRLQDTLLKLQSTGQQGSGMFREISDEINAIAENNAFKETFATLGPLMQSAFVQGEEGVEAFGRTFLSTTRKVIKAALAETIAQSIVGSAKLPFPANVVLAGLAAGAMSALFNSLVPKFAEGGLVTGPTYGLIGEGGQNEYVLPLPDLKKLAKELTNGETNQGGGRYFEGVLQGQNILLSAKRTAQRNALLY